MLKGTRMYKSFCRIVLLCMTLTLLFMCAGCGEKKAYPPYYEMVKDLLGQDVETVVAAMELNQEDFTYEHPFYIYNKPVQYMGYNFDMRLVTDGKGACFTVMFIMLVEEDPELAANTIVDLRDRLIKTNGEPETNSYQEGRPRLETTTYDELYSGFTDKENHSRDALEWTLQRNVKSTGKDIYMLFSYGYPAGITESDAVEIRVLYALETEMELPSKTD